MFTQAVFEYDKIIKPLNLREDIDKYFKVELFKKFTPKAVKIKAIVKVKCYSKNGIEDIKNAL